MNLLKKIVLFFCDKDVWLETLIDTHCWFALIFVGGYIAFVTEIEPKIKIGIVIVLALTLYIFCGIIKRFIFKKIRSKSSYLKMRSFHTEPKILW
jgi:hypothetical protein